MNNDMEKKLDQLLERLPKTQYDTKAWLEEDMTDEYDRMVSQRRRKTWVWRWSAAAVIVALLCTVGIMLQKEAEVIVDDNQVAVVNDTVVQLPVDIDIEEELQAEENMPPQYVAPVKVNTPQIAAVSHPVRSMTPIDSLADIVEHIELAMQGVRDSCYLANVEKLIRTDDRLQRLVNQLILDGILADTTMSTAYSNPQHND